MHYAPDRALPLVRLKERRREIVVALQNSAGQVGDHELRQLATIQQATAAIKDAIADQTFSAVSNGEPRTLTQSANCAVTYIVRPGDIGQHLPRLFSSDCLPSLMAGQLRPTTEDHPLGLRTLAPLTGPCSNQFAFKLGKTA